MFGKNKTVYSDASFDDAVELSENFAQKDEYKTGGDTYSVTSTLIFGLQWDATMQFFDNNYINGECGADSYVVNEKYGWRITEVNEYKKTGTDLISNGKIMNRIKNIYDMAGNIEEITYEGYSDDDGHTGVWGTIRGSFSASDRYWTDNSGFRIALYL